MQFPQSREMALSGKHPATCGREIVFVVEGSGATNLPLGYEVSTGLDGLQMGVDTRCRRSSSGKEGDLHLHPHHSPRHQHLSRTAEKKSAAHHDEQTVWSKEMG